MSDSRTPEAPRGEKCICPREVVAFIPACPVHGGITTQGPVATALTGRGEAGHTASLPATEPVISSSAPSGEGSASPKAWGINPIAEAQAAVNAALAYDKMPDYIAHAIELAYQHRTCDDSAGAIRYLMERIAPVVTSSAPSGETLPEWVQDSVGPARDDLRLGNQRPDSMAGALVFLADENARLRAERDEAIASSAVLQARNTARAYEFASELSRLSLEVDRLDAAGDSYAMRLADAEEEMATTMADNAGLMQENEQLRAELSRLQRDRAEELWCRRCGSFDIARSTPAGDQHG